MFQRAPLSFAQHSLCLCRLSLCSCAQQLHRLWCHSTTHTPNLSLISEVLSNTLEVKMPLGSKDGIGDASVLHVLQSFPCMFYNTPLWQRLVVGETKFQHLLLSFSINLLQRSCSKCCFGFWQLGKRVAFITKILKAGHREEMIG